MKRIVILGTGGNCIDILDTLNDINRERGRREYECVGFLDDDAASFGKTYLGVKVLGTLTDAQRFDDCLFVNGIGSSSNFWQKRFIIAQTQIPFERFATVIHPSASVSQTSSIGQGTVIFQNVTVTTNVKIGNHIIILPNTVISHHDQIGDYCCIAGGTCISGYVTIGEDCYIGSNAVIRERITIGEKCLIGAGSVVLKPVPANSVMVGNPARFLRHTVSP